MGGPGWLECQGDVLNTNIKIEVNKMTSLCRGSSSDWTGSWEGQGGLVL